MSLLEDLQEPFAPDEILWRVGTVAKKHPQRARKATLLAYINARAAMDRLDEAVGPDRWRDSYREGAAGGLICRIELLCTDPDGETLRWVGKEDGAENTAVEAVKGGMSDAFKRCGVKWGVGRYLYRLPTDWHAISDGWGNGKGVDVSTREEGHIGWIAYPPLPPWAMPRKRKETPSETQVRQGKHDPSWPDHYKAFCADLLRRGWTHDQMAAWLEEHGHARPSRMLMRERIELLADIDAGKVPYGPKGRQS